MGVRKFIVGILESIARVAGLSREAFGKTVEEIGAGIRAGDHVPNEAFERSEEDGEILDNLYDKHGA